MNKYDDKTIYFYTLTVTDAQLYKVFVLLSRANVFLKDEFISDFTSKIAAFLEVHSDGD